MSKQHSKNAQDVHSTYERDRVDKPSLALLCNKVMAVYSTPP